MVGQLIGVFGVNGELKCKPKASMSDAIIGGRTYALSADSSKAGHITLARVRRHHKQLVVKLASIETVESAQAFVGKHLFLPRDTIALGPHEYFDDDLIGLRLCDPSGGMLGTVVAIEHHPAQDCLVIAPGNALVPLVHAYHPKIDLCSGSIAMDLPPGLL